MNPTVILVAVAAVAVGGAVVYALRRYIYEKLAQGGGDAERARRAENDLDVSRRQGKIMTEQVEIEDVIKDLDDGRF